MSGTDLLDAFREAVRRHPRRPAIVHNGQSLGYAELDSLVRRAARSLGPAPGMVGVLATHAPSTVISLLGALAAGGAYCPIDPAYPAERVDAMLTAVGCRTVLDPARTPGEAETAEIPFAAAAPDDPAYVLFTSGSTGDPKPVVTPRGAISTAAAALVELFDLRPADRVLQFASLNWDTCFEEILPTLTAGAALVFDDEAHTGSFPRFRRMVAEREISVLDLPTAFWHELVRHLAEDGAGLPDCLRLVVIGGEAAAPARLADWHRSKTSGIRLLNTYGCTETTMITHAAELDAPQPVRIPIGRALARAAELDGPEPLRIPIGRALARAAELDGPEPVRIPIGRALPHVRELISDSGELWIGGAALALGYLGRPGATAERFVERPDGRWFRTGDRVGRGPGGLLFPEGRLDHQVKIRGVRVDPAEVEAHLTRHPAVAAAAVTGVRLAGRTVLVGYVAAPGAEGDRADLLGWLRRRVPAHLVPSRITYVPELVHTASGKVDRAGTHRRYAAEEPR